jgi:hypothetical protein
MGHAVCLAWAWVAVITTGNWALAKQEYRRAFFEVYPDAVGSVLDGVPSRGNHCGVCHYDFRGGGPRNPHGLAVEEALDRFPSTDQGRRDAIWSIRNADPDGDGFTTFIEVTDRVNYSNTPTFPGLTPGNVQNVSRVDVQDIIDHLVPTSGEDITPPEVTVIAPDGGERITANQATTVRWSATDDSGIARIDLFLSLDDGVSFRPVALGMSHTGSFEWFPGNRPTASAIFRVEATDNASNQSHDDSDGVFTVLSPPGGVAPTTLRDFDQPGSQPLEAGVLNPPEACAVCHGNYDPAVEPFFNWQGSMMSQASRDPLFAASMVIANQDAPDSGDVCLRCHLPRGWLQGRSVPTDGSRMLAEDHQGVACDLCHRLVDIFFDHRENPSEDQGILENLEFPPSNFANGMYVVDPTGARRGPFVDATGGHPILVSPFHREAAICGTCHDVSNPAFQKDGQGNYPPNPFDRKADSYSSHTLLPIERTYSEWFFSDYNTPEGVYAPQFGGNRDYVATCQDCHMRDVTGKGCNFGNPPQRPDLPLHDMTGGNTWMPGIIAAVYPGEVNPQALQAGIARARYMLQHAADLSAVPEGGSLKVTVVNNTGHKLPTGYPEGRRMWINVRFFDANQELLLESGAYDPQTGDLTHDDALKIYETKPGLDTDTAELLRVEPGPSFHFVLNNKIYMDNRIPPRGFVNADYAIFGGAPVEYSYPDGQYWDDTYYDLPADARTARVTLYYQSTSREFVEFLRDENRTNDLGQQMYDLWNENAKSPPEVMGEVEAALEPGGCIRDPQWLCDGDVDGNGAVNPVDVGLIQAAFGSTDPQDLCNYDVDCNGAINPVDVGIVQSLFGSCDPPREPCP